MASKLNAYLADAARRRAFREAMGLGGAQPQQGQAQGQTQGQAPQAGVGSQRAANQRGGMASGGWLPPVQGGGMTAPASSSGQPDGQGGGGGFLGALAGGAMGFATGGPIGAGAGILASLLGGGGGGQRAGGPSNRTNRQEYLSQQNAALQGQMPEPMMQGAVSQGLGMVNAQAQQSRTNLGANMASRGLVGSGIAAGGYADIEQARLGGVERLAQQLAQMAYQRQESAMGRQAGMLQQSRAIEASQPQWWETLAQAAVPVSQYLYAQQHPAPDLAAVMQSIFGGGQAAQPATPTRGYVPAPTGPIMPGGEYVPGRA